MNKGTHFIGQPMYGLTVEFEKVLLVDNDDTVTIGAPTVGEHRSIHIEHTTQ